MFKITAQHPHTDRCPLFPNDLLVRISTFVPRMQTKIALFRLCDPASSIITRQHTLNKALLDQSEQGNLESVKTLVEQGACIFTTDPPHYSPLHLAAIQGHPKIITYLGNLGAPLTGHSISGVSPIHDACLEGHMDCVRTLLQLGANPNSHDRAGYAPSYYADFNGHYEIVILLVNWTNQ